MKTLAFFLGWSGLLLAQNDGGGPLALTPPLVQSFPMVQTDGGVELDEPVLLNLNTIIPAHALLRVCYVRPPSNDPAVNDIRRQQSSMEGAMTRPTPALAKEKPHSPEVEAAIRLATRTVWPKVVDFEHAFTMINAADMRLVYIDPKTGEFVDEIFNLPEGLLLAQHEGKVKVLAVESHRSGETAGFRSSDLILEIGGTPLDGTLPDFLVKYRVAQATAEQGGTPKLIFKVQRKGAAEPIEIDVTRPPSLKGSLLDMN